MNHALVHRQKNKTSQIINHQNCKQSAEQNNSVKQLLARHRIQAKLKISQPDDPLEKEADEMADRVMGMSDAQAVGKSMVQAKPEKSTNNQDTTRLPGKLKNGIEFLSGYSMDDVKVHYNSPHPTKLDAHAFTRGSDIHLASGAEKYLPHEAWHVVQQKQGRVLATRQMGGEALQMKKKDSLDSFAKKAKSTEKIIKGAKKAVTIASELSRNKVILRIRGVFDTADEILKPFGPVFKSFEEFGKVAGTYSKFFDVLNNKVTPYELILPKRYIQNHKKINILSESLQLYNKNGLSIQLNKLKDYNLLAPTAKLALWNMIHMIYYIDKNISLYDKGIIKLKKFNQVLWGTYRSSLKKAKLAKFLQNNRAIHIALAYAGLAKKGPTTMATTISLYKYMFEVAYGDYNGLASDCLKSRKRAAWEIKNYSTQRKGSITLYKNIINFIRLYKKSHRDKLKKPGISPAERKYILSHKKLSLHDLAVGVFAQSSNSKHNISD